MRVLVTGGRDYARRDYLFGALDCIDSGRRIIVIIHGAASGADSLADQWAVRHRRERRAFPAEWDQDGRAAGPIRNARMIEDGHPDIVVAFPGGIGTADMVRRAFAAGVRVLDLRRAEDGVV